MLKKSTICLAIFSILSHSPLAQENDFESYLQKQDRQFEQFAAARLSEFEDFVERWQAAEQAYRTELSQHWDEVELTSQTRYVEYSDDQQQRTIVDYENNQVIIEIKTNAVETPSPTQPEVSSDLLNQVNQTLNRLTQTQVSDAVERDPIHRQVGGGQSSKAADAKLLEADEVTVSEDNVQVTDSDGVTRLTLQLPTNLSSRRANEALPQVKQEAERWNLPPALILAIIHTESSFNPMARSPIPAFGLMQIVPQSAGRDVTEFLTGQQQLLSPEYLYNPQQNIEAGSVYLHLLYNRYFNGVQDDRSRWYLSIAAYNTGPGNVTRTLTGRTNLRGARDKANQMSSQALFDLLVNQLPAQETRLYLQKVTEREVFYQQQLGTII